MEECFVDLYAVMREHYPGVDGSRWGLLITDPQGTRYDPVVERNPTPAGEKDMARHVYARLEELRA